jgi:gamma-glutamylcyclotransferase (GGCT)/AIG2-like uncharacterized protein YtfP
MTRPREKGTGPGPAKDTVRLPVFVYGTLRPGQKNYTTFLAGRTLRETPAVIKGRLFYVEDGGYPYLLPGGGTVRGDLIELRSETYQDTLRALDELEEYDPCNEAPSVYLRRRARVTAEDGRETVAWVYYWNRREYAGKRIEDGDFGARDASEG